MRLQPLQFGQSEFSPANYALIFFHQSVVRCPGTTYQGSKSPAAAANFIEMLSNRENGRNAATLGSAGATFFRFRGPASFESALAFLGPFRLFPAPTVRSSVDITQSHTRAQKKSPAL